MAETTINLLPHRVIIDELEPLQPSISDEQFRAMTEAVGRHIEQGVYSLGVDLAGSSADRQAVYFGGGHRLGRPVPETVQQQTNAVRREELGPPLTASQVAARLAEWGRLAAERFARNFHMDLVAYDRAVRPLFDEAANDDHISAAAREAAFVRGETLLREWLTPAQLAQYDREKCFEVIGCHTGRRYRIDRACAFNVKLLRGSGTVEEEICFLPAGNLVSGDVMLAQKLALETDENAALAVANRQYLGPERRARPGGDLGYEYAATLRDEWRPRGILIDGPGITYPGS